MSAAVSTGTVTIGAAEWRALCDAVTLNSYTLAVQHLDPSPKTDMAHRDAVEDLNAAIAAAARSAR